MPDRLTSPKHVHPRGKSFHVAAAFEFPAYGCHSRMGDAKHGRNLTVGLRGILPQRVGNDRPALCCTQVAADEVDGSNVAALLCFSKPGSNDTRKVRDAHALRAQLLPCPDTMVTIEEVPVLVEFNGNEDAVLGDVCLQ